MLWPFPEDFKDGKPPKANKNEHKPHICPLWMRNYAFQFQSDATGRSKRFYKFANTHCAWFTATWDINTGKHRMRHSFGQHAETSIHIVELIVDITPMVRPRKLRREHHRADNNFYDFVRECIDWDRLQSVAIPLNFVVGDKVDRHRIEASSVWTTGDFLNSQWTTVIF